MENITQALIIVGSVLIVLLIIAMSILVFNIAKDPVSKSVDNMSKEERSFFNSKFKTYEGGRIAGLEAKALINLSMQNAYHQLSLEEKERIPEIILKTRTNTYPLSRAQINSTNNAETYKNIFQEMLNKTINTSFYSVEIKLNAKNGIVNDIYIEELDI